MLLKINEFKLIVSYRILDYYHGVTSTEDIVKILIGLPDMYLNIRRESREYQFRLTNTQVKEIY